VIQRKQYINPQAIFFTLTNKNGYPLYKIIAKNWNSDEQNELKNMLQSLI
jgi:Tfp pilus assembly protein PilX